MLIINIMNIIYFESMIDQIYPIKLQINKLNPSDTEVPFMDLNLLILDGNISVTVYNKRDDFEFRTINFPF